MKTIVIILIAVLVFGSSSRKDEPCARKPKMQVKCYLNGKEVTSFPAGNWVVISKIMDKEWYHKKYGNFYADSMTITAY